MSHNLKSQDKNHSNKELIQREAIFKAVYENSIDAIGVAKEGLAISVNPAHLKLFGYTHANDLIGKPAIRVIAPSEHARISEYMKKRAMGKEVSADYETIGLRKDGSQFDLSVRISTFEMKGEKYSLAILKDVTKRNKAVRELKESEDKYSKLFSTSPNIIVISSLEDGRFVDINERGAKELGYSKKELIGKTSIELGIIQPEDRDVLIKKLMTDGFYAGIELPINTKSGELKYGLFHGQIIQISNNDFLFQTIVDLTARKQAESELKASEEKYSSVVQNSNDGIIIYQGGKIAFANDAAIKILGFAPKEIIGENITDFVVPEDRELVTKRFQNRMMGKDAPSIYEIKVIKKDGKRISVELNASVMYYKGEPAGLVYLRDLTERKKAEEALKVSEEQYRIIYENAPDAYYSIDLKGKYVDGNAAAIKMIGMDKAELVGKNILKTGFLPKNQIPKAAKLLARNVLGKSTGPDEFTLLRRDGSKLEVEISTHPVKIRGKTHILSIARDITERKEAEKIIKESEEQYRMLVDNIPDVTWSTDSEGRTNFISSNVKDVYGFTPDAIFRAGEELWFGRVHKDDLQKLKNAYKGFFEEDEKFDIEYRIKHKNGKWIWLHDRAIMHTEKDKKKFAYGVFTDITERKNTEEEIRKLSRAVQQSANSIIITDKNGAIEYVNPSFEKFSGYISKDVVGKNPRILKSGETPPEEYKTLWDTINAGNEWAGEFHNRKKNGELYWESATITPIKNADEEITHFLGIKEDITARKKAVQEREHALAEAEMANQIKSNFLANMSHEIRTPLNAILGFTDLIENDLSETISTDLKKYFSIIQESGDRLINTVHGILDISQIETGTIKLNPELIDLQNTITHVITTLQMKADKKQVAVSFDSHIRNSNIHSDPYCVTQAISNIVDNAIKYTEKGSVSIQLHRKGKKLIIYVSDTGIGMTKQFMERMFDPFTQESEGFTKKYEGVGIGLPLTKRYLDLIDAELKVESEKGKGSRFTLIFKIQNSR